MKTEEESLKPRDAFFLPVILLGMSLPAWWADEVGGAMLALLPEIDLSHAYFSMVRPHLQYLVMPIVLSSCVILVTTPGLLIIAAAGRANDLYRWLIEAFVINFFLVSGVAAAIQFLTKTPLTGAAFFIMVLCLGVAASGVLFSRTCVRPIQAAAISLGSLTTAIGLLGIPVIFAVALMPKMFWESFTGDGAHMFETARLLLFQTWPFWPESAGDIHTWPALNSATLAYPLSWFVRLFGTTEAAVRLPMVLFIPLLFCALRGVIAEKRAEAIKPVETMLIWIAILSYALTMCYNATYNPYSADIALPTSQDTLVMIFFLGSLGAWIRRDYGWLVTWTLLTLLTSPAGFPMFASALVGLLVSARPWRWHLLIRYGVGLVSCICFIAVLVYLLELLEMPTPGSEHGLGMLRKFAFLAIGDFERFLYAFLPVGIYPAFALLAWRQADEPARVLIIVTALMFTMYYIIGASALHYFVPTMLLPVAIFWRRFSSVQLGKGKTVACGLAGVVAIWFALPVGESIYTATRDVGTKIDARAFQSYHEMDFSAVAVSSLLGVLFPTVASVGVPEEKYGDSPLAWYYYAQQSNFGNSSKAYALVRPGTVMPLGIKEIGRIKTAALFVLDETQWMKEQKLQPTHSRGNPVYQIDRDVLWMRGEARNRFGFFSPGNWILDLLEIDVKNFRG